MRDFPVFDTETGVSSLILREIPYRGEAYIHIQDIQPSGLEDHMRECVSFCRIAGADKIYARGHEGLLSYPVHTAIRQMRATAWTDPAQVEHLFPVTEKTVSQWRSICNDRLRRVDNASTLTAADEQRILSSGGAYFIHHDGELLGVGWMEDTKLLLVASVKRGAGERVMHTLMSLVEGSDITLEVASTNARAIRFYERLGFMTVQEAFVWRQVWPCGNPTK